MPSRRNQKPITQRQPHHRQRHAENISPGQVIFDKEYTLQRSCQVLVIICVSTNRDSVDENDISSSRSCRGNLVGPCHVDQLLATMSGVVVGGFLPKIPGISHQSGPWILQPSATLFNATGRISSFHLPSSSERLENRLYCQYYHAIIHEQQF